jgi:hypothetical protein
MCPCCGINTITMSAIPTFEHGDAALGAVTHGVRENTRHKTRQCNTGLQESVHLGEKTITLGPRSLSERILPRSAAAAVRTVGLVERQKMSSK